MDIIKQIAEELKFHESLEILVDSQIFSIGVGFTESKTRKFSYSLADADSFGQAEAVRRLVDKIKTFVNKSKEQLETLAGDPNNMNSRFVRYLELDFCVLYNNGYENKKFKIYPAQYNYAAGMFSLGQVSFKEVESVSLGQVSFKEVESVFPAQDYSDVKSLQEQMIEMERINYLFQLENMEKILSCLFAENPDIDYISLYSGKFYYGKKFSEKSSEILVFWNETKIFVPANLFGFSTFTADRNLNISFRGTPLGEHISMYFDPIEKLKKPYKP